MDKAIFVLYLDDHDILRPDAHRSIACIQNDIFLSVQQPAAPERLFQLLALQRLEQIIGGRQLIAFISKFVARGQKHQLEAKALLPQPAHQLHARPLRQKDIHNHQLCIVMQQILIALLTVGEQLQLQRQIILLAQLLQHGCQVFQP